MRCRVFLAVALVASAAWGGACRRSPAGRSQESPDERPNVLLITTDTTRADRLGCYGYADAQTPALDALATSGVRCAQAFCQVPLTLPSHVSLMTSTDPPSNGIHVNGGSVLGDTLPTLAGTFKDHGYRTGAFVGAWVLNAGFGLSRGFDHYDDNLGDEDTAGLYSQRSGEEVCDAALAWLGQHAEAPFFAWVHFFDPHRPYTPPSPFREKLADPYDGEIAFMDTQIARLMDWLEARDLRQRTLIVVAGDHGEAFGERGEMGPDGCRRAACCLAASG
jgi:arylsulfatase A-like enzyme